MQVFLASDVLYADARRARSSSDALNAKRDRRPDSRRARSSCPSIAWLQPDVRRQRARPAALQRAAATRSGTADRPRPARHGPRRRPPTATRRCSPAPRTGSPTRRARPSPSRSPTRARTTSSTSRSRSQIAGRQRQADHAHEDRAQIAPGRRRRRVDAAARQARRRSDTRGHDHGQGRAGARARRRPTTTSRSTRRSSRRASRRARRL